MTATITIQKVFLVSQEVIDLMGLPWTEPEPSQPFQMNRSSLSGEALSVLLYTHAVSCHV